MTPHASRWAEALAVERMHGADAPRFVAERIGALASVGDQTGVDRWMEIARRLDALRSSGEPANSAIPPAGH